MYANKWSFAEGPIAYQGESLLPLSHHRLIPRRHWIWTATGQLPVDKIRNLNVWHGIRGWMEMAIQWSNTKGFFPFNKWEPIEGHKRINNNSRGNDLGDSLGLIPSNVSLSLLFPAMSSEEKSELLSTRVPATSSRTKESVPKLRSYPGHVSLHPPIASEYRD